MCLFCRNNSYTQFIKIILFFKSIISFVIKFSDQINRLASLKFFIFLIFKILEKENGVLDSTLTAVLTFKFQKTVGRKRIIRNLYTSLHVHVSHGPVFIRSYLNRDRDFKYIRFALFVNIKSLFVFCQLYKNQAIN